MTTTGGLYISLINYPPEKERDVGKVPSQKMKQYDWFLFPCVIKAAKEAATAEKKRSFFKSFGAACNVWQVDMKMRDGTLFEEEHESKNMLISTMKDERGKNLWIEIKYWFLSMCGRWWWWKASLHALPKCIS